MLLITALQQDVLKSVLSAPRTLAKMAVNAQKDGEHISASVRRDGDPKTAVLVNIL